MYLEACFALCATCLPSLAGLFKIKAVQHLVAGFSNMISSLTSSKKGSRLAGSEQLSNKKSTAARYGSSSVSEQSEPEIVLTSAAAGAGKADTWIGHHDQGTTDIEMGNRGGAPKHGIQVDRSWELSRE